MRTCQHCGFTPYGEDVSHGWAWVMGRLLCGVCSGNFPSWMRTNA